MASLNKIMLIGNTGRDAELRYTANGTAQCNFTMAVNYRRRGQTGDWEDQTEWFNIILFGDQAERVSQYIVKGKQIFVEGRVQTRSWDDDQGVKHFRLEVIGSNVVLLGSRDSDGSGGGGASGGGWGSGERSFSSPNRGARPAPAASRGGGDFPGDPDDLPFE